MSKVLTAFYDMQYGPVSFDFVVWLGLAMRERDRAGCDALHIVIVPQDDARNGFSREWGGFDQSAARWRLWHILVGACPLAGATLTLAADRNQAEAIARSCSAIWWPDGKAHFFGPLCEEVRKTGCEISLLSATPAAKQFIASWRAGLDKRPLVTLTLRNHAAGPLRNTSAPDWAAFQKWLDAKGYNVVTLEDTDNALKRGRGWAELDVDLRLALYEASAMNCTGINGPGALLILSRAPYLIFESGADKSRELALKLEGVDGRRQYPWAGPRQRSTYAQDRFDLMRAHFEGVMR